MLHFELEFGRHSGVFTTEGKLFAAAANPQCCGKIVVAGDWRRGSALPSHGRGHWFDPSIAHFPRLQQRIIPSRLDLNPRSNPGVDPYAVRLGQNLVVSPTSSQS